MPIISFFGGAIRRLRKGANQPPPDTSTTGRDDDTDATSPAHDRSRTDSPAASRSSLGDSCAPPSRKSMSLSRHPCSQETKRSSYSRPSNASNSADGGSGAWLRTSYDSVQANQAGAKARSRQQSFESWVSSSDRTYHDASQGSPHHGDGPKRSFDSTVSSNRSSFARERPSFEQPLVEAVSKQDLSGLVAETLSSLAEELHYMYLSLAVLQPDAPVPLSAMQLIWDEQQPESACSIAEYLKHHGVLRLATLEDGSLWCLVEKDHLNQLQVACAGHRDQLHASLLANYNQNGRIPWEAVPDDGYILQHLGHHMQQAGQMEELKGLLLNPSWLQLKLQEYGVCGIIADLRRYIQTHDSPLVKLVLLALQASVGPCTQHQAVKLLRTQLTARLMRAADYLPDLKEWHAEQMQYCLTDSILSSAEGRPYPLMPTTASLAQTGGSQRLLLRHTAGTAVTVVILMPSGTELMTASDDGTLMMWEMDTGECTKHMRVSNEAITAMGVTPDAHWCVVGTANGQLCIWNLETDQVAHRPKGHTDRINALVVEGSGWRVATASSDHTARLWGVETGECQFVLAGHGCGNTGPSAGMGVVWDCAFSSDSSMLGTVSDDFTARIWDSSTGHCLHVLEGHSGWVVSGMFVPDTNLFVSASHDGTACVWDAEKATLQHVLKGHAGRVTRVRSVKGGTLIVTAADDYTVHTWDSTTGECLSAMEGHSAWTDVDSSSATAAVVATTSGDYALVVWDPYEGTKLQCLLGHTGMILDTCFSHKGRFVITASEDSTVRVWDLNAPGDMEQVKHDGRVKGLCLVHGGNKVASIGDDCVMRIWDMEAGTCCNSWIGHRSGLNWVVPCSDSPRIISVSADRKVCSLDLDLGDLSVVLASQQGSRVKSFDMDAQGRIAVVALYDSTVTLWNLDQQAGSRAPSSGSIGQPDQEVPISQGGSMQHLIRKGDLNGVTSHRGGINAVYMSADGGTVVTVSKDNTSRVWDVATMTCRLVLEGHEDSVNCAVLSPDDRFVATASYDRTTRYWSLEDGQCLCVLKHSAAANHLSISPDGSMLGCVADDNIVTLSRLPSGQQVAWLTRHSATVNGVVFSPDAAHAITFSDDCTLQVWDVQTSKMVALFAADDGITSAVLQQGMIVAGDAGGSVHFLPFPPWEHCFQKPGSPGAAAAAVPTGAAALPGSDAWQLPQAFGGDASQCGWAPGTDARGASSWQTPPEYSSDRPPLSGHQWMLGADSAGTAAWQSGAPPSSWMPGCHSCDMPSWPAPGEAMPEYGLSPGLGGYAQPGWPGADVQDIQQHDWAAGIDPADLAVLQMSMQALSMGAHHQSIAPL